MTVPLPPLPPLASPVDRRVYLQGVTYDPLSAAPLGLTEGLEVTVGPTPGILSFGDSVRSTLNPASEFEIYEFAARAGDQLVTPFARTTGYGFSLQLDLYDAFGVLLDTKRSTADVFDPVVIPSSGRYFLWVSNPGRNVTGSYHLTLQRTVAPGNVTQIVSFPTQVSGSIHPTWTEIDVYEFMAAGNLFLKVPFSRTTGYGFTLELRLYDASGTLVHSVSGTSGRLCVQVPSTGRYFLWVRNPAINVTGNYSMTVTLDVNGC